MEAQRFPEDFDGISAGAPRNEFPAAKTLFITRGCLLRTTARTGSAILTAAKLPALHAAALASCDALDGLKDGQITDPRACHFDAA